MPNIPLTGLRPPGPLVLDVNISNNWKAWYCAYPFYATAEGIKQRAERVQCSVFLHMAGGQAQLATMEFAEDEKDRIGPLLRAFQEFCQGKASIIITRYKFNSHCQASENMTEFITALRDKIRDCDYGSLQDSLL